jgi:hypothetical protein
VNKKGFLMAWINVKDKLPAIGEPVLVSTNHEPHPVREALRMIENERTADFYWTTPHPPDGRGYIIQPEDVTHWTHKPPKAA